MSLSNIPPDIQQQILGRMTPSSLDRTAFVNKETQKMVQLIAKGRLERSFDGSKTAYRPSNELLLRSIRWPVMIDQQAFAKLGKITAALQTVQSCVIALQSSFIPSIKEMIVLDPPKWVALFPLQKRVDSILSFEQGDVLVLTEDYKIEKYRMGHGKVKEVNLSAKEIIIQNIGEKIPFIMIYHQQSRAFFLNKETLEMVHSFFPPIAPKALFYFGGKLVLLYQDGCISEIKTSRDPVEISEPTLHPLSCLKNFHCASSNLQELHFTVENEIGSTLYLMDRRFHILSQVSKKVRFEKMVRIQEYILGLCNNCIYAESVLDFLITSVFIPENGHIIDFCPSEEGIVRVLVQQSGRIVMTHLRFFPYKKLRMNCQNDAHKEQ
jgi:hypothetical protein